MVAGEAPTQGKTHLFQESAKLAKRWASLPFEGGTLRDYLCFCGVSLWDIVAPYLAVYVLPEVLARYPARDNFFNSKVKPRLRWCRDQLRELGERRHLHKLPPPQEEEALRLMFLRPEPRQIEAFAPVMELDALRREEMEITIVGSRYRPVKKRFIKPGNRKFVAIEDFYSGEAIARVRADRKLLAEKMSRLLKDKGFREALSYQGCPLWGSLKDEFFNLSCHTLPQMVKLLALGERLLQREKPHIIVGAADYGDMAHTLFLLGKGRGIPTLHIQYGVATLQAVNWQFMPTDKAAVFDQPTLKLLTSMGLPPEKLVITGQPRFDRLFQRAKGRLPTGLGIDPNCRVVLFTSQPKVAYSFPSEKVRRNLIADIYRGVARVPQTVLLVKPHPDENPSFLLHLRSQVSPNSIRVMDRGADTQELILACDALITFASTTALEAVIAAKPVLMMEIPGSAQVQYQEFAWTVKSQEEITSALTALLNNQESRDRILAQGQRFLSQHSHTDGRASERVAELILSMIRQRKE